MVTANAVQPRLARLTAAVPLLPTKATPAVMAAAGSARALNVDRMELPAALTPPTAAPVPAILVIPANQHLHRLQHRRRLRLPVLLPALPASVLL